MIDPDAEKDPPIDWFKAELDACRTAVRDLTALLVEGRDLMQEHADRIAELEAENARLRQRLAEVSAAP